MSLRAALSPSIESVETAKTFKQPHNISEELYIGLKKTRTFTRKDVSSPKQDYGTDFHVVNSKAKPSLYLLTVPDPVLQQAAGIYAYHVS